MIILENSERAGLGLLGRVLPVWWETGGREMLVLFVYTQPFYLKKYTQSEGVTELECLITAET